MNLLTLQQYDYNFSCQRLPEIGANHAGLFMHCNSNNDVDSYLMGYCETKTLHDNMVRLVASLQECLNIN